MRGRAVFARLREWLRPPRRLRLQRGGTLVILGVFGLGIATLNTGNNLLYLLVGALLGLIALSGWLSEQSISRIRVERRVPHSVTAGEPLRLEYRVHNRKRRLPTVSLELSDAELSRGATRIRLLSESAYFPFIAAGESAAGRARLSVPRRGVYRFERLVAATAYPFGLFLKERDLHVSGTLTVWPRTDRPVRAPRTGGGRGVRRQAGAGALPGAERGEYRGLRPYRPGDDPRDVHWRTSARSGEPMVREYDRESADTYWLVLDVAGAATEADFERAVEVAAAAAAMAAARGDRFGFAAGATRLPPSGSAGQLEAVLDGLADVEWRPGSPLVLPAAASDCVLVSARAADDGAFADVLRPQPEAQS